MAAQPHLPEPSHVSGDKEAIPFKHSPNIPAQGHPIERNVGSEESSTTPVHMPGDDRAPRSEPSYSAYGDEATGLADIDEIMKDAVNSPRDSGIQYASNMLSEEEDEVRFCQRVHEVPFCSYSEQNMDIPDAGRYRARVSSYDSDASGEEVRYIDMILWKC